MWQPAVGCVMGLGRPLGQPRWGSRSGAAAGAAAWGGSQPRRMGEELGPKHHRTYRALVLWISPLICARASGARPLPRPTHIGPHPKRPPVSRASESVQSWVQSTTAPTAP